MESNQPIISVNNVYKHFGKVKALDGVSLEVQKGSIVGLLGPNGAGKTTLVRILSTLLTADAGSALVAGLDVQKQAGAVRNIIGLTGQFSAVDDNLTGRENISLIGSLYHLPRAIVKQRTQVLLEKLSLADAAKRLARTYSGGMKRRLDIAASLVAEPEILFLDEPTTGLDPKSRLEVWETIQQLVKDGTTVLLTTQYLEEADYLADHIVIIDQGKVVAQGSPKELKSKIGEGVMELHLAKRDQIGQMALLLQDFKPHEDSTLGIITLPVPANSGTKILLEVVRRVDQSGIEMADIELRKPSLDEVFLQLTSQPNGTTTHGITTYTS